MKTNFFLELIDKYIKPMNDRLREEQLKKALEQPWWDKILDKADGKRVTFPKAGENGKKTRNSVLGKDTPKV